jgi:hypothetical protein
LYFLFCVVWPTLHLCLSSEVRVVHIGLLYLLIFFDSCCDVRYDFCIKRCLACLYSQLFFGGLMSNWFCLYLYTRSGVQYVVLLCIFMFSVLCCDVCDGFLTKRCSVRLYHFLFVVVGILRLYEQHVECLTRGRNSLPFSSTWVHTRCFCGGWCCLSF